MGSQKMPFNFLFDTDCFAGGQRIRYMGYTHA